MCDKHVTYKVHMLRMDMRHKNMLKMGIIVYM